MLVAYSFVIASILGTVSSQTSSRHPICKQIEDVFHALCVQQDSPVVLRPAQSLPGKRGAQGEKGSKGEPGLRGERGPPGLVDYSIVNLTAEEKIKAATAEYIARLNEATSRIKTLETTLQKAEARITDLENHEYFCAVKFDSKCFWLEIDGYNGHGRINYNQGYNLCRKHRGNPANVYSSEHYQVLKKLLVPYSQYSDKNRVTTWTGMTFDANAKIVSLRNDSRAPYTTWYPGHPIYKNDQDRVGITIRENQAHLQQGMVTIPSSTGRHGVICEKEF